MLADLVGPIDLNGAIVLAVSFVCVCIIITSLIIKRRSRVDISNEFELKKIKQHDDHAQAMFIAETARTTSFKQIDKNLITSHRQEN